jgi:hypothetical protein
MMGSKLVVICDVFPREVYVCDPAATVIMPLVI